MSHRQAHARGGFTLVELMIVVVIIGILAVVAIPRFDRVARSAKESEAMPILKQLYTLQERYKQRNDQFARTVGELEGASAAFTGAQYYEFEISNGDGTAYLACAKPKSGYDLSHFTIDANRVIVARTGGCS